MTFRPVLIFDFDGTIADSLDLVIQEYNRIAPRYRTKPVAREELPRLRRLKANAVMREHNVSFWKLPFIVSKMRSAMHSHVESLHAIEGVVDAVRALHADGIRCSVLSTNSNDNIQRFLNRYDLRVFEHIAGGSSMFGKARALRRLIKRAQLNSDHVYYVGDEARDVEAAAKAEVRSIAVSWGFADRNALLAQGPHHLLDRPEELVSLFQKR